MKKHKHIPACREGQTFGHKKWENGAARLQSLSHEAYGNIWDVIIDALEYEQDSSAFSIANIQKGLYKNKQLTEFLLKTI